MWLNEHPYLSIYILGCASALILSLFKIVLFYSIDWIIKANILNKNIRKIMPPEEKTFAQRALTFLGILIFEMLLSWINVFVVLFQVVTTLIRIIRDSLAPAPEAVKNLRFPLKNNPHMTREAVWAYLMALKVKAGDKPPDEYGLIDGIKDVSEHYPTFNFRDALNQLDSLNVISPDSIKKTIEHLQTNENDEMKACINEGYTD